MDPVRNPYVPGAGTPPAELAGRDDLLKGADTVLKRAALGRSIQSPILVGLRGVGKTVLLVKIRELAQAEKFRTASIEATEAKNLPELLVPDLRRILLSLSLSEKGREQARKGLRVLKSFLGVFKLSYGDIELGIEAEAGVADTGQLSSDLTDLIIAVGEAAKAAGTAVAILIDELQYLSEIEFSALITSIHKVNQYQLPVVLIGAGLPQILALAGESKSYSERLFTYPTVGPLEVGDAISAIVNPARDEGVSYTDEAIEELMLVTERYPYFLQQWGHEAWNLSEQDIIDRNVIVSATAMAIKKLDESFFRHRFDRCNASEKRYMRALAELGPGHHKSGSIAEQLGLRVTSVGPTRSKLITKGMIYSHQHGDTAFTVPLFDSYMRRVMPDFKPKWTSL
ncbi:AAA family ATPase [Methylobacterium sp. E-046]|uniref:AAA family ATPase n=1 Tax=Methylobacterium sp. E-046 TaxID=2836576 RepID=UPI001FB9EFB8|nr:AAA family ATPase [Methylobacterium sp. E-046]MCJ2099354.1 ATP-binding protein [Methylobacterium sp. E-046]